MAAKRAAWFGVVAAAQMLAGMPAIAADTIPRWDIAAICAASALGSKCPAIESQNRRAVFQRWELMPVTDRTACAETVTATGQLSYRALLSCLEERQLKTIEVTPHSVSTRDAHDS